MQRKFLLTTILIIMLIFSLTINCYANDSSPVYSVKKLTGYDLPDFDLSQYSFLPSTAYILMYNIESNKENVSICVSSKPFIIKGNNIVNLNSSDIYFFNINDSGNWVRRFTLPYIQLTSDRNFIYSNVDILYENSDNIFMYAYTDSQVLKSVRTIKNMNVMSEIIYILPVVLAVLVSLIGIKKGISFIKRKSRNA